MFAKICDIMADMKKERIALICNFAAMIIGFIAVFALLWDINRNIDAVLEIGGDHHATTVADADNETQ